ncbi:hypothetical protein WJX73_007122 [Symbiochloris irregularis]|uniref:Holocytochrome c-type synthase n=1 Tax=Symbiochloris irregularis TaxID=706552 RepID=A0AAW1NWK8_9CHLO
MGAASSRDAPDIQPRNQPAEAEASASESACPVPEAYRNPAVYNVYSQRINDPACPIALPQVDPRNNMPIEPNQMPSPGQRKLLSTSRATSDIPKGGTASTWTYPSPQMFYNALKRKGKDDGVTEDDMDSVVAAHNSMNEMTWQHVLQWERLRAHECGQPTLLRFLGRPHELSPLARLQSWRRGTLPFDRHDWYVDRCGKEVRYVIDFYFHDDKAGTPEAFTLRVRPAVDSLDAVVDRLK